MNDRSMKCPYCGDDASGQYQEDFTHMFVTCPSCGRFEFQAFPDTVGSKIKDKIASYLYYTGKVEEHADYRFYNFVGSRSAFDKQFEKYPWCHYASTAEIEAFYPKTFAERIDRILLGMAKKSLFFGDKIVLSKSQLVSAMFVRRFDNKGKAVDEKTIDYQLSEVGKYIEENGFVEHYREEDKHIYIIKPDGYKRIDKLQTEEAETSKNVFVAMSFADDMKEVREAIKTSILDSGYIPRIMDEIEHNHQIVPEMLYEIRKAKFVIAELTGHNNGAYFEAGYALGQGKEVIQICSKDRFGTDGHFDVKQINTILWETTEELTQKLSARIKATIK